MVALQRGQIWWAELGAPEGSAPGFRRPVLVIQSDAFNRSRAPTVIVAALSSNVSLADVPGNVLLPRSATGLPKDSVANVTQIVTIDRNQLEEYAGRIPARDLATVTAGLRLVLDL